MSRAVAFAWLRPLAPARAEHPDRVRRIYRRIMVGEFRRPFDPPAREILIVEVRERETDAFTGYEVGIDGVQRVFTLSLDAAEQSARALMAEVQS